MPSASASPSKRANPPAPSTSSRFYADGVVLDLTHKRHGAAIEVADLRAALDRIGYALKPRDIVSLWARESA